MNKVALVGYNLKLEENRKTCIVCNKEFRRRGIRKFTAKFCSIKCKAVFQTGKTIHRLQPKKGSYIKCHMCPNTFYKYPGVIDRKFCSKACYYKSDRPATSGKNHYNWKGGIKGLNQKLRGSRRYIFWRKKVFIRDNWICQHCGSRGGKLECHHIKSWSEFPELRFDIDNGLTLCKSCHKKTDNYKRNGKRNHKVQSI